MIKALCHETLKKQVMIPKTTAAGPGVSQDDRPAGGGNDYRKGM
jgi:hypothetical protein